MRLAILTLPLLATLTAFAQVQSVSPAAERAAVVQGSCPVSMSARQVGITRMYQALATTAKPDPLATPSGLHVELKPSANSPLQRAELIVHYRLPEERAIPVNQQSAAAKELSKTYTLIAADGDELKLTGYLRVGSLANITHVTIRSIEFADGTKWQPSASGSCSVAPSPLVLVAAR